MVRSLSDSVRRAGAHALVLAGALALAGCINIPEGETTCPGQGPNSASWPYCNPAEPGGPGPVDDPIDPTGPY
ncbi:hypothetical protein E5163_07465 [Marinicauda algicola]|uniref:Lipoprotein n=1 Tax=Marinicauda algicola TaxID=2029849 RepID=A0A4S2H0L9_9PROT|nr:hypothetical protein [Marinicauda algicola]TGY88964.1 hypothetical protein E5163_07465 [Marinicauda algicola]